MLTNLLYILVAILLLCALIVIHELGHFIVGRLCGVGVIEFSVGFGPKLVGWRRKDTDYSIRAIPLGGYCKFVGEDDESSLPNAMNNMPVWKRFLTVAAGPAMNVLFAYLAGIAMLCLFYGTVVPSVDSVAEGTPAQYAELQVGDRITAANGTPISFDTQGTQTLREIVQQSDSVTLSVLREGEELLVSLSPDLVIDEETGESARQIGVTFEFRNYRLSTAIPAAGSLIREMSTMMLDFLRDLIFHGEGVEDVSGPVGTVAVMSQYLAVDPSQILYFALVISLNLGIMNLIPFPGLDGSRLVFLAVEAIRRKPVPPEKEGMVHAIGLLLLVALSVVILWNDICKYIL